MTFGPIRAPAEEADDTPSVCRYFPTNPRCLLFYLQIVIVIGLIVFASVQIALNPGVCFYEVTEMIYFYINP